MCGSCRAARATGACSRVPTRRSPSGPAPARGTAGVAPARPWTTRSRSRPTAVARPSRGPGRSQRGAPTTVGAPGRVRPPQLVVPGVRRPVGFPLLEELVPAFCGLVGAVRQAGRLAGEHLLANEAVVDEVERELQHALGRRALAHDLPAPFEADPLELVVGDDGVDHAHAMGVLGGVGVAEEEDLTGELLAHLAGQVRRAEPAV